MQWLLIWGIGYFSILFNILIVDWLERNNPDCPTYQSPLAFIIVVITGPSWVVCYMTR